MTGVKITEFSYKYMTYPIDQLRKRVHIVVDVIEMPFGSFAVFCPITSPQQCRGIRRLDLAIPCHLA